jgi:hypothetical protein
VRARENMHIAAQGDHSVLALSFQS